MSNSQVVIDFVKRRKKDLIRVFGGKCCLCGFDKWPSALEFHHVDPKKKEFGITTDTTTKAIEKQQLELKKCIMVCANCHRGIHSGDIMVPDNWESFYNEDVAEELRNKVHAKVYYCKRCGKEKSRSGVLCFDCSRAAARKAQRPSREELKGLIRTTPFIRIALMYNVSDNAIRKWCEKMELPSKQKEILSFSDDEWEKI